MVIVASSDPDERANLRQPGPGIRAAAPIIVAATALAGLLTFTARPDSTGDGPLANPDLSIPPTVVTAPPHLYERGSWVETEVVAGDPLGVARTSNGYVFPAGDGVVLLRDDGSALRSDLASVHSLGGLVSDASRVVAYGSAFDSEGYVPALWESVDGEEWSIIRLPWQGTVQTVAFEDGGLLVAGVRSTTGGLRGVLATEAEGAWLITEVPTPQWRLYPSEGGFVVWTRLDGEPFAAYSTSDFERYEWFADTLVSRADGGVTGMVNGGPEGPIVRLPELGIEIVPPSWLPLASAWEQSGRLWLQTTVSLWTSTDRQRWDEIPLENRDPAQSVMAIPVGDTPRIAVAGSSGAVRVYEWRVSS